VDNEHVFAGARPTGGDGLRWLTARGVRSMLTLERELCETVPGAVKKERRRAEELGFQCFHIPLHPLFTPLPADLDRVVAFLADPGNLVNTSVTSVDTSAACASGRGMLASTDTLEEPPIVCTPMRGGMVV
jgi:hypothetical protein